MLARYSQLLDYCDEDDIDVGCMIVASIGAVAAQNN